MIISNKYKEAAEKRIAALNEKVEKEEAVKLARLPKSKLKSKMRSKKVTPRMKKIIIAQRKKKGQGLTPRPTAAERETGAALVSTIQKIERRPPDPNFKLNTRHHIFAGEYIKDLSISQTAKRMSASTKTIRKWLAEPQVLTLIEEAMARRASRLHMSQDEIVTELSSIARVKVTDLLSFTKRKISMKSSDEISDEVKAAISSIEEVVTKYGGSQLKVRFHDKKGALELLGRHYGMFLDRQQVEEDLTVNIVRYEE